MVFNSLFDFNNEKECTFADAILFLMYKESDEIMIFLTKYMNKCEMMKLVTRRSKGNLPLVIMQDSCSLQFTVGVCDKVVSFGDSVLGY